MSRRPPALIGPERPIVITTSRDLVPYLAEELRVLHIPVTETGTSHIEVRGTYADTFDLNLRLRTAQRVLYMIAEFRAMDPEALYSMARAIQWERSLDNHGYVSITSTVSHPMITDSRYPNLKMKDAIMDRMREATGARPDSGPDRGRTVIHLHWQDNNATVYLDTSGEPLYKRGYRKSPVEAPMQESLAVGVIMATGWDGRVPFVNPMAGSGTLAIEAALIASHRAPGLTRDNFGFMHVREFAEYKAAWERHRKKAEAEIKRPACRIVVTDISRQAIEAARANAHMAGVAEMIEFKACAFEETPLPDGGGVVIMNPPYGERLGDERELESLYPLIGDFMKQKCAGRMGYVFTGNPALGKRIGLRPKRRLVFHNGRIECRLLEYELYKGGR